MSKKMYVRTYIWGREPPAPRKIWRVGVAKYAFIVFSFINIFGFWFHWKPIFSNFPENKTTTEKSWSSRNKQTYTHTKNISKAYPKLLHERRSKTQYTFRRRKLKNTPDDESDITFFRKDNVSHEYFLFRGYKWTRGTYSPPTLSLYVCMQNMFIVLIYIRVSVIV